MKASQLAAELAGQLTASAARDAAVAANPEQAPAGQIADLATFLATYRAASADKAVELIRRSRNPAQLAAAAKRRGREIDRALCSNARTPPEVLQRILTRAVKAGDVTTTAAAAAVTDSPAGTPVETIMNLGERVRYTLLAREADETLAQHLTGFTAEQTAGLLAALAATGRSPQHWPQTTSSAPVAMVLTAWFTAGQITPPLAQLAAGQEILPEPRGTCRWHSDAFDWALTSRHGTLLRHAGRSRLDETQVTRLASYAKDNDDNRLLTVITAGVERWRDSAAAAALIATAGFQSNMAFWYWVTPEVAGHIAAAAAENGGNANIYRLAERLAQLDAPAQRELWRKAGHLHGVVRWLERTDAQLARELAASPLDNPRDARAQREHLADLTRLVDRNDRRGDALLWVTDVAVWRQSRASAGALLTPHLQDRPAALQHLLALWDSYDTGTLRDLLDLCLALDSSD